MKEIVTVSLTDITRVNRAEATVLCYSTCHIHKRAGFKSITTKINNIASNKTIPQL